VTTGIERKIVVINAGITAPIIPAILKPGDSKNVSNFLDPRYRKDVRR